RAARSAISISTSGVGVAAGRSAASASNSAAWSRRRLRLRNPSIAMRLAVRKSQPAGFSPSAARWGRWYNFQKASSATSSAWARSPSMRATMPTTRGYCCWKSAAKACSGHAWRDQAEIQEIPASRLPISPQLPILGKRRRMENRDNLQKKRPRRNGTVLLQRLKTGYLPLDLPPNCDCSFWAASRCFCMTGMAFCTTSFRPGSVIWGSSRFSSRIAVRWSRISELTKALSEAAPFSFCKRSFSLLSWFCMDLFSCRLILLCPAAVSSFCWASLWSLTKVCAKSFTAVFWVWSCIIWAVSISSLLTVFSRSAARWLALMAECDGCEDACPCCGICDCCGFVCARQNGTASARTPATSQVDECLPIRMREPPGPAKRIWSLRCKQAEHRLLGAEAGLGHGLDRHPLDFPLPGAAGRALGFGLEGGDAAGHEGGIAVLEKLAAGSYDEAGLLPNFPAQRLLGRFPEICRAARKGPAQAVAATLQQIPVAAADERNRAAQLAEHRGTPVDGDKRLRAETKDASRKGQSGFQRRFDDPRDGRRETTPGGGTPRTAPNRQWTSLRRCRAKRSRAGRCRSDDRGPLRSAAADHGSGRRAGPD